MNGVDYAGYHLHLITDDHTAGGHLLDCIIQNATVEIDQINSYNLVLPYLIPPMDYFYLALRIRRVPVMINTSV